MTWSGEARAALCVVALGASMATATAMAADRPADPKRGHSVAQKWCSPCHVVGPRQKRSSTDAAPPFAEIANDPEMTPARLRGILERPHNKMPTEALYREEIADLIAYIESLREQ